MTYVLYLDRYHLGDPLFLNGFARDVLNLGAPCLIVHGAGEAAERALEARGQIARWDDGVLVADTASDRALVARAARDLNRRIAHTLNDAGVAAVSLEAGGRGMIVRGTSGVQTEKIEWLRDLVAQRAVPVIASLVADTEGGVREANGGAVAGALAKGLAGKGKGITVIFLGAKPLNQKEKKDLGQGWIGLGDLAHDALPEPESVRAALAAGVEVRVVRRTGLWESPIRGVRIVEGRAEESP